jgi:hypothetical protein
VLLPEGEGQLTLCSSINCHGPDSHDSHRTSTVDLLAGARSGISNVIQYTCYY